MPPSARVAVVKTGSAIRQTLAIGGRSATKFVRLVWAQKKALEKWLERLQKQKTIEILQFATSECC